MTIYSPEEVLPHPDCTILRHECYGSTGSNQIEITRTIKSNFDNGITITAFTIAVHANPEDSCQDQELAFMVEYSDGHIELFDRHSMSINRRPRESEILSMLRTLVYLGAGNRLFFCTKRLRTEVFQQPPLMTTTVIKSKGVKSLLPHWHEFTSVNNEGYKTFKASCFKHDEWEKIAGLTSTAINKVQVLHSKAFIDELVENDEVIVGYVGRRLNDWIFVCRRGRTALICFVDKRNIELAYHSIVRARKFKMKAFGDFVKDSVLTSTAQQMISVNQEHFITDFNDHYDRWLFRLLEN